MKSKEERWAHWEEKMRKQPTSTFLLIKFVQYGLFMTTLFILFNYFFEGEEITLKNVILNFVFFSIFGPSFEYYLWKRRFKSNE
jgi:hypothetical protein